MYTQKTKSQRKSLDQPSTGTQQSPLKQILQTYRQGPSFPSIILPAVPDGRPIQRHPLDIELLGKMSPEEIRANLAKMTTIDIYLLAKSIKNKFGENLPDYYSIVVTPLRPILQDSIEAISTFMAQTNYTCSDLEKGIKIDSLTIHALFEHLTFSLYPKEIEQSYASQQAHKTDKYSNDVHRPILDIEFVDNKPYARCYLALFKPEPDKTSPRKEIDVDDVGKVIMRQVGVINLGNPFKALLWCEDYLHNQEHYKSPSVARPSPVIRSFLITLEEAGNLISINGAFNTVKPVDMDRASGQFRMTRQEDKFDTIMHPLAKSLVSFYYASKDVGAPQDGHRKFMLDDLMWFLTGHRQSPTALTKKRYIAAQHNRTRSGAEPYSVPFNRAISGEKAQADLLDWYYQSVDTKETGLSGVSAETIEYHQFNEDAGRINPQMGSVFPTLLLASLRSREELDELPLQFGGITPASFALLLNELPFFMLPPLMIKLRENNSFPSLFEDVAILSSLSPFQIITEFWKKNPLMARVAVPQLIQDVMGALPPDSFNPEAESEDIKEDKNPLYSTGIFHFAPTANGNDSFFHALAGKTLDFSMLSSIRSSIPKSLAKFPPDADALSNIPSVKRLESLLGVKLDWEQFSKLAAIPDIYLGNEITHILLKAMPNDNVFIFVPEYPNPCIIRVKNNKKSSFELSKTFTMLRDILKKKGIILFQNGSNWKRIDNIAVIPPVPGIEQSPMPGSAQPPAIFSFEDMPENNFMIYLITHLSLDMEAVSKVIQDVLPLIKNKETAIESIITHTPALTGMVITKDKGMQMQVLSSLMLLQDTYKPPILIQHLLDSVPFVLLRIDGRVQTNVSAIKGLNWAPEMDFSWLKKLLTSRTYVFYETAETGWKVVKAVQ